MQCLRIDYRSWFLRVIGWDGLMPFLVASFPVVVDQGFKNPWKIVEPLVIALPIAAFFVRLAVGMRYIKTNHCAGRMRDIQLFIFIGGLHVLVLFDGMVLLSLGRPAGNLIRTRNDIYVCVGLILFYLICMTFAMYPGRTLVEDRRLETEPSYQGFDNLPL
jgi:hypothetical protein